MSISSILNSASLGLAAQQVAMQTSSQNIANASVAGYTRQEADLQATMPTYFPIGAVGTGVMVANITNSRDTMLDSTYWSQSSQASGYSTRSTLLTDVSNIYGEPSDNGLSAGLDQFWSAWSDLANNPGNNAAQSVVQQRGANVASILNQDSQSLSDLATSTRNDLNSQIGTLNQDASQIADLNRQIVAAESGGKTANDLRDSRDRLLDSMSSLVPLKVIEQPNGSDSVYVANIAVVDGVSAKSFSLTQSGSTSSLQINGQSPLSAITGGSIGASLTVLNTDIPGQQAQLNQLAQQLVTKVNAIHETGWTQAGDAAGNANWSNNGSPTGSNVDFFDPSGTTAATIALSSQVQSNASYIAAGNVQNGTGDNSVANQIAQLGSDTSTILTAGSTTQTTSFGAYFNNMVTNLGVSTNEANSSSTVYQTLVQQTQTQRQSADGVSTDQELVTLMQQQQAYAAAAKVVTTANTMAQSLLDMV